MSGSVRANEVLGRPRSDPRDRPLAAKSHRLGYFAKEQDLRALENFDLREAEHAATEGEALAERETAEVEGHGLIDAWVGGRGADAADRDLRTGRKQVAAKDEPGNELGKIGDLGNLDVLELGGSSAVTTTGTLRITPDACVPSHNVAGRRTCDVSTGRLIILPSKSRITSAQNEKRSGKHKFSSANGMADGIHEIWRARADLRRKIIYRVTPPSIRRSPGYSWNDVL